MILDSNVMTDVKLGPGVVAGKAATETNMLRKGELILGFDGIRAALNFINENMPNARQQGHSSSGGAHAGNHFDSYEEAMDTYLHHPEKVVHYDPLEMKPLEWDEQGNDLEYDVTGDFIDVGRVLEGIPESFGSLHNGNPRNRRVRIVVATMQAHWMEPEWIDHRSERIIRLIDALENAHVRTELITVDTNKCAHTEIIVKRFDEPLTVEDVAVSTHSDFFRRMGFRVMEYSDTMDSHYGDSTVMAENIDILRSQMNDELTVYIDSNMSGETLNEAFDSLEKKIEEELNQIVPKKSLMYLKDSWNHRYIYGDKDIK